MHTGERFYICTECDYACIQVGYLKRHIKTYTGENLTKYKMSNMCISWESEETHENLYRKEILQMYRM